MAHTGLPAPVPSQLHSLTQEHCGAQPMPTSAAKAPVPCTGPPPCPQTPSFAPSNPWVAQKGRIFEDDDAIFSPLAIGAAALLRQQAAPAQPLPQASPPPPAPAAGLPFASSSSTSAPGTPSPPSSFTVPEQGPATPTTLSAAQQQGACQGFTADGVRQRSVAPFEVEAHKQPYMLQPTPTFGQLYKKELARTLAKAANADPKKSKKVGKQVGKVLAPMAGSPCGPCLLPLAFLGVALYFPIKAAVKAFQKAKLQERLLLEQEMCQQQQRQLEAQQFAMAAPAPAVPVPVPLQAQAQARAVPPAAPQQLPVPLVVPVQAVPQQPQQPQQPQAIPAMPQSRLPEPLMPAVPQHPLPQCLPVQHQHPQPVCILAA